MIESKRSTLVRIAESTGETQTLTELFRKTNITYTHLSKIVKELEKKKVLILEKKGRCLIVKKGEKFPAFRKSLKGY